ncbi:Cullin repeat-like-containing domain protein [Mycena polygramma]|nr:Cullin repeat-like-containing domain protein [Mycena polygramma]
MSPEMVSSSGDCETERSRSKISASISLEQNLTKTRQISQRMTSTFGKPILPLYTSTQILNRRPNNVEKPLLKMVEVASNQEGIAAEEALILRGPKPGQLPVYQEVLERLSAFIAPKAIDRDSRLVETGRPSPALPHPPNAAPFTPAILNTLRPRVAFMRMLPLPASHPSHSAAPAIMSTLKDAQKGRKCLEGQGRRVVDRADKVDSFVAGEDFRRWVESLLSVADSKYKHIKELSPLSSPNAVAFSCNVLLNPLLSLFSTTLTSLIAFIKRSLHTHTFANELLDWLGRSAARFPGFLADIKVASWGLPEVQSAASAALLQLGDGNWKMGHEAGGGDEQVILEHFNYDVRRPAHGSMYLLNDNSYLLHHALCAPHTRRCWAYSPKSRGTRSTRASARVARPLLQTLTDDPGSSSKGGGGGAKAAVQDKSTRFSELLGESRLLEDPEAGMAIGEDVVKLVVPSLVRFTDKYWEKELSKNPQKYIKQSSDDVERQLKSMYR